MKILSIYNTNIIYNIILVRVYCPVERWEVKGEDYESNIFISLFLFVGLNIYSNVERDLFLSLGSLQPTRFLS